MAEKLPMTHCSNFLLPPARITDTVNRSLPTTHALIILNQRLPRFSPLLWEHSKLRMCADGGGNRLFDNMPEFFPHEHDISVIRERYKPDVIKGDMDSIRPDVLNFYRNLGTKIIDNSCDQDSTDLHKCITYVLDFMSDDEKSYAYLLLEHLVEGLTMRWETLTRCVAFQQHGLFFCLMIVLSNFFLKPGIMRLMSCLRLRAHTVVLFPLAPLPDALQLPDYNGILIIQK